MRYGLRLALLAGLLTVAACAKGHDERSPAGTLVRLADDEVKSLDPQKVSDLASLRVAADQFEGLTRYRGDGTVEAGLASGWFHDGKGIVWHFRLKPGLRFSNRDAIDANIFAAVFNRLRDPATGSPGAALFSVIETLSAQDSRTIIIRLHHPFPALPELLAQPAMAALPIARIEKAGDGWTADRPLVTSGPYRLRSWTLNDRIMLEANPFWHDGKPAIARVEWKPVDDRQSAFRRFRAGEADLSGDFPSERKDWLNRNMPGAAQVAPYRGSYYFVFNTRRPPFNDRRVRIALNLAVERRLIADKLLHIGNPPAWGVVPPALSATAGGYHPGWAGAPRAARLGMARRLLEQAGFNARHPLRFEIRFNSDVDHRRVALALLDGWRSLPVKATLLNTEATLHFASLKRGDFQLARAGWIGDISAPENFLQIFTSDAGAINYPGYHNPQFDRALDAAMNTSEPAARGRAMAKAEAVLMKDAPVLPIYYYVTKNLVGQRVVGWHNNIANIHPSRAFQLREK